ncbi:MAG: hypothetical protein SVR94_01840 [Pseudomonadota bacterium]|nr:hypothetical protein [Pseudomonadota bacterium]
MKVNLRKSIWQRLIHLIYGVESLDPIIELFIQTTLKDGQVFVMDNAAVHQAKAVVEP